MNCRYLWAKGPSQQGASGRFRERDISCQGASLGAAPATSIRRWPEAPGSGPGRNVSVLPIPVEPTSGVGDQMSTIIQCRWAVSEPPGPRMKLSPCAAIARRLSAGWVDRCGWRRVRQRAWSGEIGKHFFGAELIPHTPWPSSGVLEPPTFYRPFRWRTFVRRNESLRLSSGTSDRQSNKLKVRDRRRADESQ
jgi:hypothetical protein